MSMPKLHEINRLNIPVVVRHETVVEGGKKHNKLLNWKRDKSYVFLASLKVSFVSNRSYTFLRIIMSPPVHELGRNKLLQQDIYAAAYS